MDLGLATCFYQSKVMMALLLLLVLLYAVVVLFYGFKFSNFKSFNKKLSRPKTFFHIIIPFRNEANHLPQLLKSLKKLHYPKDLYTIYLVDDFSDDSSKSICQSYIDEHKLSHAKILENQNLATSPKKSAVLTALEHIKTGYVITTDADCILPEYWLLHYNHHIQQHQKPHLIAGAVCIATENNFWTKFQVLDLMSLQVIGLGSFKTKNPLLCNAANLAYDVETLKHLKAFDKHQSHISGDDIFNLQIYQQSGKNISALVHPKAMVWTKAQPDFYSLTQQRIRWASKAKHYKNNTLIGLGLLVFLTNFLLVLSLFLALFIQEFRIYFWSFWGIKLIADYVVLDIGRHWFKPGMCMRDYLLMLLIYPFVNLYFAILSLNGKFYWKGRNYKV